MRVILRVLLMVSIISINVVVTDFTVHFNNLLSKTHRC